MSAGADLGFVHRWVPGDSGSSLPTLLLLHGTGGNESDLLSLGPMLLPGANVLSPRGNVSENGAPRFFRRLAEGVFDMENLRSETDALHRWLAAAREEYGFSPDLVIAVGFSNGANMAASLLLTHSEDLKGAFLMRAMVPFVPQAPPSLMGTRILLASGETDPMVPRDNAERLASMLVQAGADVEHLWLPTGHNLTRQELEHARQWLSGVA